jgi:hypothetical protein
MCLIRRCRSAVEVLAVLLVALFVAGCASNVAGTATSAGGGSATESSEPTDSSEPTESSEPTDATQTTEPTDTSESESDPGELGCEGENVVAPPDQPFCFDVPEGFQPNEVDIENQAGSTASYTTGILLSERDVIVFSVYQLNLDSDDLSDEELIGALSEVIDQLAAQGFDFTDTKPQVLEVDGARAFYYTGSDASGLSSDTYFIFRGATELQVNCQWQTMEAEILSGCEQVLDSLKISG